MASLTQSIMNWIRGKRDDAAQSIADPVRDGKFAIEDSETEISKFQVNIAKFMAENKKLEKQRDSSEEEVNKFNNIATKAAKANNTDDAREALVQKSQAQARVDALTKDIDRNQNIVNNLRKNLQNAKAKVTAAKSNHAQLKARSASAQIRTNLAKATSDFGTGGSPLAALDDLQRAVESDEAEAEAFEELAGSASSSLEEKYSTDDVAVDDELNKLMAANNAS